MTLDLDERFPHENGCGEGFDWNVCDCDRDARIAAHIERLEGALRFLRQRGPRLFLRPIKSEEPVLSYCIGCGMEDAGLNEPGYEPGEYTVPHATCPVPGIEALMAELGGGA